MLEDGMSADFASPLMKSKMAECSLALEPIMCDIGQAIRQKDIAQLTASPCNALKAIRSCLDVTTFQRDGGTRGRDRFRYAKDSVTKMAVYGEGHCRTCSSCMASFLWAFSELLCVDLLYRMDEHGSHQWLQFDVRPTMRSFICDLLAAMAESISWLEKEILKLNLFASKKVVHLSDIPSLGFYEITM
jgi:hypothetical protein